MDDAELIPKGYIAYWAFQTELRLFDNLYKYILFQQK